MRLANITAHIFAWAWGIKDRDFSPFFIRKVSKELSLDRDSLDQLVLARLKEILRHAEQASRYYARAFAENNVSFRSLHSVDDMLRFPCLTRDALRESLPEILSGGKILPTWRKSATGGTTSSPVPFYCDEKALWEKNAFSKAMDCWYGRSTGDKIAFLWGAPQDLPDLPTLGMRLRNLTFQHYLILPSSPLDTKILQEYYESLIAWKPSFLQAYPTPLYEFCLFLRKQSLKLPSLRGVSVTAEALYHGQRQLIEETLNLRLFNWYGSRELGRVASECECHNGLHVNEPSVYVEIESDPSLPGDCGHLIVTDLFNRATPLIRYRTGDIARFVEGACPCGRSLRRIAAIEGRLADLIVLANGRKVPGVSLTNRVVKDFQEICELQIIQKTHRMFLVHYVRGPKFSTSSLGKFLESFYSYIDERVDVTFKEVDRIPIERSGKARFVISEINEKEVSS